MPDAQEVAFEAALNNMDGRPTAGLVAALARCQAKFPAIVKSHINPAFKGSQYADVADVLAAVRPVLAAEGLAVSQWTNVDKETGAVELVTCLLYGEHERLASSFPLHTANLNAQGVGSLMTYHRRYQLCALLGVHPVGDDDDGNLAATAQEGPFARADRIFNKPVAEPVDRDKPLAAMTMRELLALAAEMDVAVSGTKSDIVRTLEPLVRAASGDEPWSLEGLAETDKPPSPEPEAIPFEPVLAKKQQDSIQRVSN